MMKSIDLNLLKKTEHSSDVPSRHIRLMAAELERLQAENSRLEAENLTLRSERANKLAEFRTGLRLDRQSFSQEGGAGFHRGA